MAVQTLLFKRDDLSQVHVYKTAHDTVCKLTSSPTSIHTGENAVFEVEIMQHINQLLAGDDKCPYIVQLVHASSQMYNDILSTTYLETKYCKGGDLFDALEKKSVQNDTWNKKIIWQVSSAVAWLHSNGIAHGDVSLENIFLQDDNIRLGDFGGATFNATRQGSYGKKLHAPPECFIGSRHFDVKKADVFALGVVLFNIITGLSPFAEASEDNLTWVFINKHGFSQYCKQFNWKLCPDAVALIATMLLPEGQRPSIDVVLDHPYFDDMRLGVAVRVKKNEI